MSAPRSRGPSTPPPVPAPATPSNAATPRPAGDLLLPDGDDLLGMTAHMPGEAGARVGSGAGARGGGGGAAADAGEMGRMAERIAAAAAAGGSGGGSGAGLDLEPGAAQASPPPKPLGAYGSGFGGGTLPQRPAKGRGAGPYMQGSPGRGPAPAYGRGAGGRAGGADAPGSRGRGRRGAHTELGDPYAVGMSGAYGGGGGGGAAAPSKAALAAGLRAERLRQELPQRAYAQLQQVQLHATSRNQTLTCLECALASCSGI